MDTIANPVLELAVFSVNTSEDNFMKVQNQTHEMLATFPGFIKGFRLISLDFSVFADLIAWRSYNEAKAASDVVTVDPRFAPLRTSIDTIQLYGHYHSTGDVVALLEMIRRAPVFEVAAYSVHDVATFDVVHQEVYKALETQPGYRMGAAGRQLEEPSHLADLICWDSKEAHERVADAMQNKPALSSFFSGIEDMKLFKLFKILG